MITKDSLIILQSGTELTGALCRLGMKSREVPWLHRAFCADLSPEAVASGLRSLLDGLRAAGLKRPDDVRVCLSADATLFRDWVFPFRARAKVEQALSLLLETEFPFDASILEHRVCLAGPAPASGPAKGVQAISVSLRKEDRSFWLDAFEAEGLFPSLVTVDPFPLLGGLPKQTGVSLLLHVRRDTTVAAVLDGNTVRRIRSIPGGWTPEGDAPGLGPSPNGDASPALRELALRLRRETALVLEGLPFSPERLSVYGEAFLRNGAAALFSDIFELPVAVPGQDGTLAGQAARLGETDPDRLLALCVAAMPSPAWWRQPAYPSFHRPRAAASGLSGTRGKRMLKAACGVLCVGLAYLGSVWAEGYADHRQALRHEEAARAVFRKAVPDARGSFNPVQMESILRNRIGTLRGGAADDAAFPVLHLLEGMHAAIPGTMNVRIDRLSLDARRCGLSGTAAGYEQVNAVRDALAALPGVREAKILSAANRTGKPEPGTPAGAVIFEIELALEGGQS